MSENELAITGPAEEESAVVRRFIEASREVVPSVQVSLAKRIVRPGSNRVLCLAAHTSAPLSDSEVASVSDLALRLSDGTNVVLSLAYFNDAGAEYLPTARWSYDPERYNSGGDSRLSMVVLVVGVALAVLGSLFTLTGPARTPFGGQRLSLPSPQAPAVPVAKQRLTERAPRTEAVSARRPPVAAGRAARKADKTSQKASATKASYLKQARMLVPPPPPMPYSLSPYGFLESGVPPVSVPAPGTKKSTTTAVKAGPVQNVRELLPLPADAQARLSEPAAKTKPVLWPRPTVPATEVRRETWTSSTKADPRPGALEGAAPVPHNALTGPASGSDAVLNGPAPVPDGN